VWLLLKSLDIHKLRIGQLCFSTVFQHFMVFFFEFTCCVFKSDEKVITTSSSSEWRGYVIFINISSYQLQNFRFGAAGTQLLIQLKFSTIFLCSSKGRAVGWHCVWLLYRLFSLKCVNNVGLGIFYTSSPRYSVICSLLPISLSHVCLLSNSKSVTFYGSLYALYATIILQGTVRRNVASNYKVCEQD
jgi:hypothetical protein